MSSTSVNTSNNIPTSTAAQSDTTKQVAPHTTTETSANTSSATVSPAYTVDISKEGMNASTVSNTSNAAPTTTSATSSSLSSVSTSSSSSASLSLTSYSDSQLKQMLSAHKITQAQYNTEMARREKAKEEQATSSSTSVTNPATSASNIHQSEEAASITDTTSTVKEK